MEHQTRKQRSRVQDGVSCLRLLWMTLGLASMSCNALTITEIKGSVPVTVSRGAHITPVRNSVLYTEEEYIVFTIPDLPDPPQLSENFCNASFADEESCTLFRGLQGGIKDVANILALANRILTTKGLKSALPLDVRVPQNYIKTIEGVQVASNSPEPELIVAAGEQWFSDTEAQLVLRKVLVEGVSSLSRRERRWVRKLIKPALHLAKMLGNVDISTVFQKLFVGEKSILEYLTNYRVISKHDHKLFTELPARVSELQTETKRMFLEVLNSTELVKQTTKEIQEEIEDHKYKLATIEEAFLLEQDTLADVVRSLYTSIVYSMHFDAYEECRSGHIPISFVPPNLLRQRLIEIENNLPPTLRFAIPVEDYQRYYRLPTSECLFDSDGGIIRVGIPLVEKQSNMQLYRFQPLHFGFKENTCAISTASTFIIKDIRNNRIFSITKLDEETCTPLTTGLCKVPYNSADDSNSFCIAALLSGERASVIKESCALECFRDSRPVVSQLSDSEFLGVHLQGLDVRMECGNEVVHLNKDIDYGAVRFKTSCDCRVLVQNRTVGKSDEKICVDAAAPRIDVLLPVQMSNFDDLLPFSPDAHDNTVFADVQEIFNPNYFAQKPVEEDIDIPDVPVVASSIFVNLLQSLFMVYLFFRQNALTRTLMSINALPLAEAASRQCEIPYDVYVLLWSILGLCIALLLPKLFAKVIDKIGDFYTEQVHMDAQRIVNRIP